MGDQLVGQALGEVFLLGIARQVGQWQDDERANRFAAVGGSGLRTGSAMVAVSTTSVSPTGKATRRYRGNVRGDTDPSRGVAGLSGGGFQHRIQEAIAAATDRLDVARLRRGIAERASQPVEGTADAVIEIDECAIGPETLPEFLTGDHLAGPLDQRKEELEGTLLEFDADAVFAELACTGSTVNSLN